MTILLVKSRTHDLEVLFYKRFHLYNFEWERNCKIEEWSEEMENMEEMRQYEMHGGMDTGGIDYMGDQYAGQHNRQGGDEDGGFEDL